MSTRVVRRLADAQQVSRAGADLFVSSARTAIAQRGRFIVALAGGSTPKRMYELLASDTYRAQVEWSKIEFFWGDERSVPPDHKDSNYRMANEAMLSKLPVRADGVHRMEAERSDRDVAAAEYQASIARVCAETGAVPPAFDLVYLGMGPDGHTASLFPHTTALKETRRWVVKNYVPKFSTDRMTMTVPMLNRAAHVVFLAAGADKASVLKEVLEGPPDSDRLPSQLIRPDGALEWIIDLAAAASLSANL